MRSFRPWLIGLGALLAAACSDGAPSSPDRAVEQAGDASTAGERAAEAGAWPDLGRDSRPPDAATAGRWGAKCLEDSECEAGFKCKSGKTDPFGYCTRSCASPGSVCQDADLPSGTMSYCALVVAGAYYCGFLCKMGTAVYACPGTMSCGTQETPPGTQQYWCVSQ